MEESPKPIRLNRYLAQCGLGARRKCEEIIASGHVIINGAKVTELGTKVSPVDVVAYRGRKLEPLRLLEYFAYYKPAGVMVTRNDPEGRPTIYDDLQERGFPAGHLNYAGRLDCNSEGLLLLTNDGSLIHALTHPRYRIKRIYGLNSTAILTRRIRPGCWRASNRKARCSMPARSAKRPGPEHAWEIDLYEGKNRQIRRMFEVP